MSGMEGPARLSRLLAERGAVTTITYQDHPTLKKVLSLMNFRGSDRVTSIEQENLVAQVLDHGPPRTLGVEHAPVFDKHLTKLFDSCILTIFILKNT